jgi:hypothetical protein
MRLRLWHRDQLGEDVVWGTKRRRPAFFLQALLSEDIPPYLVNNAGEKLAFQEDKLAKKYQRKMNTDPASL